jgi:hypothetical protein
MPTLDYLARIDRALASRDGISEPGKEQRAEAETYALIVQARALDRIATALEAIAADELTPTIRRSA